MNRFLNWAGASHSRPEVRQALVRAQYAAYVRLAPVLYFTIATVIGASIYVCGDKNQPFMTVVLPTAFVIGSLLRMITWIRRGRMNAGPEMMQRHLLEAGVTSIVLTAIFTAWVARLYFIGDPGMRGVIAGVFGLTILSAIHCLVNFPISALAISIISIPVIALLLALATPEPMVIGGAGLLVILFGTTFVILRTSRDFLEMVAARVEAQQLNDENSRLANIDSLTGLPNRRQFFEKLDEAVARNHDGNRVYIGVLDLDGFKSINDIYGHVVGDHLLMEGAARFCRVAGPRAFVARLGGDEFGLIIEEVKEEKEVLDIGAAVCDAAREPFAIGDAIAAISTSIGFAAFPDAGETPRRLYERADYALYFAKQNSNGGAVVFNEEHEKRMKGASLVEQCLRRADLDAEMNLAYQPLHDAETGAIVSFEALARWNSSTLGFVSPGEFVPLAERSDIIHTLSRTLLCKALKAAATWPDNIQLSFNLSARDLMSQAALTQIIAIVVNGPVAPGRIDFEITETALITDFDRALKAVHALKSIGAHISLDDFGTGYSSLSYIHRLPLDRLKIDRSFVNEMETSPLACDIIKTMIGMARNLKLDCVIEGVETPEQYAQLKSFGCTVVQGYLFSKPLAESDVTAYIAARNTPGRPARAVA
ncbi:MAG: putative bifunctional diguanylate cyclase/phosphodiesterase [Rhodoblastus sp.]